MERGRVKEMETDIDVTTMPEPDDSLLSDYKPAKVATAEDILGEEKNDDKDGTEEPISDECQDDDFDMNDPQSKISRKNPYRNPQIWQQPEIRDVVIDFINRDISSRAAASKISEMLGRSVSHSTVLMYANRILRALQGDRKPSLPPAVAQAVRPPQTSADVRFELVKTSRGTENGLAIFENNDNFVRLYRRTSHTDKSSFYRCSTCDHLYEKYGAGERPSVKVRDNVVCGNAYPLHNPLCPPTPVAQFRRAQHDLEARQLDACRRAQHGNGGFKDSKRESESGMDEDGEGLEDSTKSSSQERNFSLESAGSPKESDQSNFDQISEDEKENIIKNFLESFKIGEFSSLSELSKMIHENTGIEISTAALWKYFKKLPPEQRLIRCEQKDANNYQNMEGGSRQVFVRPTLSKYLNETIITVPEDGGYRQYSFMKKSADEVRSYYRCLGCARAKRVYGNDRFAYIKVEYGEVIDKPLHHHKCEPIAEENIVVQNLDRECRKSIRQGEKNPKEAHAEGMEKAAELSASMAVANSDRYDIIPALFPSWNNVKNAYYRQKDLSRKANASTEINETEQMIDEDEYHIGPHDPSAEIARYEEIEEENFINRPEIYSLAGVEGTELSPEMAALRSEILYEMQHMIRREVSRALQGIAVDLERRLEERMLQLIDETFQPQDEATVEILETDVNFPSFGRSPNNLTMDNFEDYPTDGEGAIVDGPSLKRRRTDSCKRDPITREAPFAIPEHYLSRRARPPNACGK